MFCHLLHYVFDLIQVNSKNILDSVDTGYCCIILPTQFHIDTIRFALSTAAPQLSLNKNLFNGDEIYMKIFVLGDGNGLI